jgi:hypothetical protein
LGGGSKRARKAKKAKISPFAFAVAPQLTVDGSFAGAKRKYETNEKRRNKRKVLIF